MRILDKYILRPIITTFLGCLLVFIFLYIISDILSRLDEILKSHISLSLIYHYYLTYLPIIFSQTSPLAILLATIYTFGKLNRNNELIAMRSSGQSLWQLCTPVVITGIILSISIFLVNNSLVPKAQAASEKMKRQFESNTHTPSKDEIIYDLKFYGLGNRLFFVNSFDTKHNLMKGITILEHDEKQNLTAKIVASKGLYQKNVWVFYEVTKFHFDKYGQISEDTTYNEDQIMGITETPQDFLGQRMRPDLMNTLQLEDYIWRLKKSGAVSVVNSLTVDLYQRYAVSLAGLILILVGIPFSFLISKRANVFSSFGICIALSFFYYALTALSLALGKRGVLFPFLAVWCVPIIFFFFAIRAIEKTS